MKHFISRSSKLAIIAAVQHFLFAVNVGETAEVKTVPAPERRQPAAARTDAEGTIHLLCNSVSGPRYVATITPNREVL